MSLRVLRFLCAAATATLSCCCLAGQAPLGLVLSGGGAKGAYEVGVWQALEAAGLAPRVRAISGTSVGALNAALFATRPDAAETLWLETMGEVFTLNTNRISQSLQKTMDDVSNAVDIAESTGKDWKGVVSLFLKTGLRLASDAVEVTATDAARIGYIDSRPLAVSLSNSIPRQWPEKAPVVYATAVEKGPGESSKAWSLNAEPHDRRVLMLRASAAIPLGYDTVEIDGKTYVDGGWESRGGDNVPIKPILENHPEIRKVIVVYLEEEDNKTTKARRERVKQEADAASVEIVEIIPSKNLGGAFGISGVFDASPDTARHLIDLGRKDAERVLRESGLIK